MHARHTQKQPQTARMEAQPEPLASSPNYRSLRAGSGCCTLGLVGAIFLLPPLWVTRSSTAPASSLPPHPDPREADHREAERLPRCSAMPPVLCCSVPGGGWMDAGWC
uniref:Uncharacterized protein n=1 Tax=Knipowitschia caucasica TaxID=637954 RepID=A0AAV2JCH5_KNICA